MCLGGSAHQRRRLRRASACGVRFVNGAGEAFVPVGGTLAEIASVDVTGMDPAVAALEIVTMCDIDNPLCGPNGAAAVFGPQKGRTPPRFSAWTRALPTWPKFWSGIWGSAQWTCPAPELPAAWVRAWRPFSAAGSSRALRRCWTPSGLQRSSGTRTGFSPARGRLDGQSLRGKVVSGVARRAGGVPVAAIVGDVGDGASAVYDRGVSAVFSINRVAVPYLEARLRARQDLEDTVADIVRVMKISWSAGKED